MAHLRILQIISNKGEEQLKVLPGQFNTDRECEASIAEDGVYLFLEAHLVKGRSKTKKKNNGNEQKEPE